jgi:hypothetical protein
LGNDLRGTLFRFIGQLGGTLGRLLQFVFAALTSRKAIRNLFLTLFDYAKQGRPHKFNGKPDKY